MTSVDNKTCTNSEIICQKQSRLIPRSNPVSVAADFQACRPVTALKLLSVKMLAEMWKIVVMLYVVTEGNTSKSCGNFWKRVALRAGRSVVRALPCFSCLLPFLLFRQVVLAFLHSPSYDFLHLFS